MRRAASRVGLRHVQLAAKTAAQELEPQTWSEPLAALRRAVSTSRAPAKKHHHGHHHGAHGKPQQPQATPTGAAPGGGHPRELFEGAMPGIPAPPQAPPKHKRPEFLMIALAGGAMALCGYYLARLWLGYGDESGNPIQEAQREWNAVMRQYAEAKGVDVPEGWGGDGADAGGEDEGGKPASGGGDEGDGAGASGGGDEGAGGDDGDETPPPDESDIKAMGEVMTEALLGQQVVEEEAASEDDGDAEQEAARNVVVAATEAEETAAAAAEAGGGAGAAAEASEPEMVEVPTPQGPAVPEVARAEAGRVAEALRAAAEVPVVELVERAKAAGHGAGEDWGEFRAMHRQAASDRDAFVEAIKDQKQRYRDAVAELKAYYQRVVAAVAAADGARIRAEAEEAANAERTALSEGVDAVRGQVNALREAFMRRSEAGRLSHAAHRVSSAVLQLDGALAAGLPAGGPLMLLEALGAEGGEDGEMLAAAAAALREVPGLDALGVPTRVQLSRALREARGDLVAGATLPAEGAGPVARAVARVASWLKVEESGEGDEGEGGGVEGRVALCQRLVAHGDMARAAEVLEAATAGTAAAVEAEGLLRAMRGRAAAEAVAQALRAHAGAQSASLV
ncbi:unnamed protein product [Pedinophyceae sp. YPF-701]|nr:unnamed protein product [Pedinophyceae sp. YPF-701]